MGEGANNMTTRKAAKRPVKTASSEPRLVTVMVNGQVTGTIPETTTIGQAVESVGTKSGIRTGNVKVDGKKINQPDSNKTLKGAKTFELYAKDSRG